MITRPSRAAYRIPEPTARIDSIYPAQPQPPARSRLSGALGVAIGAILITLALWLACNTW